MHNDSKTSAQLWDSLRYVADAAASRQEASTFYESRLLSRHESMRTGIKSLDVALGSGDGTCGGLPYGLMTCLGGRPGSGKSALACELAYSALVQGKRVMYISLEMPYEEVIGRMLAVHTWWGAYEMQADELHYNAGYPYTYGRRVSDIYVPKYLPNGTNDADLRLLVERLYPHFMESFGERLIVMEGLRYEGSDDAQAEALRELSQWEYLIWAIANAGVASQGDTLVILDYFQIAASLLDSHTEYEAQSRASKELCELVKRYGLTMLTIVSLRKTGSGRAKEVPSMDSMSGSGRLAYDAGLVMHLSDKRQEEDQIDKSRYAVDLTILKNRRGQGGEGSEPVGLTFIPRKGLFLGETSLGGGASLSDLVAGGAVAKESNVERPEQRKLFEQCEEDPRIKGGYKVVRGPSNGKVVRGPDGKFRSACDAADGDTGAVPDRAD